MVQDCVDPQVFGICMHVQYSMYNRPRVRKITKMEYILHQNKAEQRKCCLHVLDQQEYTNKLIFAVLISFVEY